MKLSTFVAMRLMLVCFAVGVVACAGDEAVFELSAGDPTAEHAGAHATQELGASEGESSLERKYKKGFHEIHAKAGKQLKKHRTAEKKGKDKLKKLKKTHAAGHKAHQDAVDRGVKKARSWRVKR